MQHDFQSALLAINSLAAGLRYIRTLISA